MIERYETHFDAPIHWITGRDSDDLGSIDAAKLIGPAVVVDGADPASALLEVLEGVQEVLRITEPYKLASRTFRQENTVITIGDLRIGGDEVVVMRAGDVIRSVVLL